ncbi:hypothetical protein N657DRAFT_655855 [Parathielavia appendiculata]|uniref:Nephrocystin 3-like N-terminal domain-containing protein n=1 Tax=Parathielavia appendiculata TaxID=2587402 RepID=A0AAN6Z4M8_9PEZI|nr:hypothetical protein N657DRAFT_655855 [Parathielavia appendiculata]
MLDYGHDHTLFSERDNKCLRNLGVTDPRDDKVRIERDKGGLLRDLYHWVLNNVGFQRWQDDRDGQLLWIRGDPSKGEMILLCGIIDCHWSCAHEPQTVTTRDIDELVKTTAPTDARINNATAVLRGLIYTLVTQQPALISHLRRSYDTLSMIFASILEDLCLRRIHLIVNTLDECTGDQSVKLPECKWMVSSRDWPSIAKDLDTAAQELRLSLELNKESVSVVITTYIRFKVDWSAKRNKYGDDTRVAVDATCL